MRRLLLAAAAASSLLVGCLTTGIAAYADGAQVVNGTIDFGAAPGGHYQTFPELLGLMDCGNSGTVDYHLVFAANGNENSHFDVDGVTGYAMLGSQILPFVNASGLVVIHLGNQSSKPMILVNHGPDYSPHRPLG